MAAVARHIRLPAPAAASAIIESDRTISLSFCRNMTFKTSLARTATRAESAPAQIVARFAVAFIKAAGTGSSGVSAAPSTSPNDGDKPRRISRARSRWRPRACRLLTVPTGQPRESRRLLVSATLQVAEDQRGAVMLRQSIDLFVDHRLQVFPILVVIDGQPPRGELGMAPLVALPADRRGASARGDSVGDGVDPGTDRVPHPERTRPLRQDEERGLEGILRLVFVSQDRPAQAQHHRPVPLDERGEGVLGRLSATGREPFEQLPVRHRAGHALVEEHGKLTQRGAVA